MRLGIGATDSMCPKKRRIRLRVLKAVAILRPRLGSRAANYPLLSRNSRPAKAARPIHCRGPLVEADRTIRFDKGPERAGPKAGPPGRYLLEFDLGALGLELGLELLGVGLRHAVLDCLGRALDQVLGLLEAEAGDLAHRLDDVDLLVADGGQHDGELVLHLRRSGGSRTRSRGDRDRSGGADAPLLFQQLAELSGLEDRQGRELLDQLFKISHFYLLVTRTSVVTSIRVATYAAFAPSSLAPYAPNTRAS